MSADNAQAEPTMEEILASIRRIISEDDEGEESEVLELDEEGAAEGDAEEMDMAAAMEAEEDGLDMEDLMAVDAEDIVEAPAVADIFG